MLRRDNAFSSGLRSQVGVGACSTDWRIWRRKHRTHSSNSVLGDAESGQSRLPAKAWPRLLVVAFVLVGVTGAIIGPRLSSPTCGLLDDGVTLFVSAEIVQDPSTALSVEPGRGRFR